MTPEELLDSLRSDRPGLHCQLKGEILEISDPEFSTIITMRLGSEALRRIDRTRGVRSRLAKDAFDDATLGDGLLVTRLESLIDTFTGRRARIEVNSSGALVLVDES